MPRPRTFVYPPTEGSHHLISALCFSVGSEVRENAGDYVQENRIRAHFLLFLTSLSH